MNWRHHILVHVMLIILLMIPTTVISVEWFSMTSGTDVWLKAVWGSSATDVFAVGESGTILHYNGTSWSSMTSGTNNSLSWVWGSSGTDVFAVGNNGTILHYSEQTTCFTWTDVIEKYNAYAGGIINWSNVMACYNQYVA